MEIYIQAFLLLGVQVICGQQTDLECCGSKEVGEISYSLVKTPKDMPSDCINECAYTRDGEPGNVYCFTTGTEPVKCFGEEEVFVTDNTCTRGQADFRESLPTAAWTSRCKTTMEDAGLSLNYSTAVGHGIHSMSLQDLRAFFKEDAKLDNGIPTANRDMCAADTDIVLENAPDIPSDFASIGLQTLDVQFQNMDDVNYMEMSDVLQRLVHSFHMHEVWTAAKPYYDEYLANEVSDDVCGCVLDTAENGINQELKNIFLFFRECHGQLCYCGYYEQLLADCQGTSMLKIKDAQSWEEKKKFIQKSMPPNEDVEKIALFLYCRLKN